MGRLDIILVSIILLSTMMAFQSGSSVDAAISSATLSAGVEMEFSYQSRSVDGTSTKSGTMTATVSEVQWRGFDSFVFEGTLTGTYSTPQGSGTESGTWIEYYRSIDLALMDHFEETDLVVGSNTVTNSTNVDHSPPLTWIEFPLSVQDPKSMWDQQGVTETTTWDRIINDDEETRESGSDVVTNDHTWVCATSQSMTVGAGTFDTYRIVEWMVDHPQNMRTEYYYSEEVGFWVQKDVWLEDGEGTPVNVRHYELEEFGMNHAPTVSGTPQVTMDEDVPDTSLDLDTVFIDPDGDDLEYSVISDGALTTEILSDNRLMITPPPNAFGRFNITVSASDGLADPVIAKIPVTVRPVDDPPVLSDPDLDPLTGDETTVFTFSIVFRDIDSAEPSSAVLKLKYDTYTLERVSGDNATGMNLEWSGILDPGRYSYHFLVDGARFPLSGDLEGPTVNERLEPYLEGGMVDRGIGGLSTEFGFHVKWVGPNGETPDKVWVLVDGSRTELRKGSGNPKTGIIYSDSLVLGQGVHSYHFEASIDSFMTRFPKNGDIDGPLVEIPELTGYGSYYVSESKYVARYGFYVHYRYAADVYPEATVFLNDREYPITMFNGTPETGMNYSTELNLEEGRYEVRFRLVSDGITLSEDMGYLDIELEDQEPVPSDGGSVEFEDVVRTVVIILTVLLIVTGIVFAVLYVIRLRREAKEPEFEEVRWER